MRQRSPMPRTRSGSLPRFLSAVAAGAALAALVATPALAAPSPQARAATTVDGVHTSAPTPLRSLPPTGAGFGAGTQAALQAHPLPAAQLSPHSPPAPTTPARNYGVHPDSPAHRSSGHAISPAAASCTPADFGSRSGSALVSFVEASTTDCVNTLFSLDNADANSVFREAQMVTVANAFTSMSAGYTGDDSTGIWQLVLFLRAGYYIQYNDPTDVGSYDATLTTAVESGIDAFTGSPHFTDVSDANGEIAGDVVILTDSANLQARYLNLYQQILNGYQSSYDSSYYMVNFVNDVFTPLFRGHQNDDFVNAVTADPSIITTLDDFALNHVALLGTDNSFLDSNAGTELARFVEHPALQAMVRPLMLGLLQASSITGPTAPLWVGVANLADSDDQADCSYYGVCDLVTQLTKAALPVSYACDATHSILAEALTPADLSAVCASLQGQDPYFHSLVKDNGPIPGQYESSDQMVVFASSTDYETYAGAIYGVDTDNGGITLTGDPTDPSNQPMSLTYQEPTDNGFTARIWNLNHEYTHALDGRYDMLGDFTAETTVPDVWWIEGLAEYVSYSYRNVTDTEAVTEAANHTYALSTIFQNTYDNSDETRTYPWGYLAVRYMFEKHPSVIAAMLADFRVGNYTGGYAVYNSIGTAYDADFNTWLDACAAGACNATGTPTGTPTAAFSATVSGLTVQLTDQSTESGSGSITARAWNFGDGTTSTAADPSKTYTSPGTYTVSLTVTDSNGQTSSTSQSVTVTGSSTTPCTDPDTQVMGQNCSRTGQSETVGNLDYLYLYLPAGTSTLRITTTGGTGNAYLYYDPTVWATSTTHTAASTKSGNVQSITVTNTTAGYRYISLYAHTAFSGVTVTTQY